MKLNTPPRASPVEDAVDIDENHDQTVEVGRQSCAGPGIIGLAAVARFSPAAPPADGADPAPAGPLPVRDSSDQTDDEDSPLRGA